MLIIELIFIILYIFIYCLLTHVYTKVTKSGLYGILVADHVNVHLGLSVSSSTHNCRCMHNLSSNDSNAMSAI